MQIANLTVSLCDYEIVPQVVRLGASTEFTARGLGMETRLTPGQSYLIAFIGQEENNSALLLDISDWRRYETAEIVADDSGTLRFARTLRREQIYTFRLAERDGNGEWRALNDFRIFCAADDLYRRTPMRGNTHCHVCTSVDGHEDPFLAAATYRKAGFDFLAVTDHHLIDGSMLAIEAAGRIPCDIALFPGEEVHIPNAYIHAVNIGAVFPGGVGLDRWYHENEQRCAEEVASAARQAEGKLPDGVEPMDFAWRKWIADRIHERGGVAILAHPFWEWDAHNTRDDVFRYMAREKIYDGAEILHGQEPGCRDANMQAAFWNDLRAEGIFISPLGADDAHRRNYNWDYESCFNRAYSVVLALSPTLEGFAEALSNGCTAAVESYENAPEHVVAGYRMTKYVLFLLDNYFPRHDELCFEEGRLMRDAYLGDDESLALLGRLSGRVKRFTDRFFGRNTEEARSC
ncbi:MAG: hypothetical protein K6C36_10400 [Clostridia bacterium]|nr:hypothetical protein [Clostridia bacterium]